MNPAAGLPERMNPPLEQRQALTRGRIRVHDQGFNRARETHRVRGFRVGGEVGTSGR
jgi:hypothetical protein